MRIKRSTEVKRLLDSAELLKQDCAAFLARDPCTMNGLRSFTDNLVRQSNRASTAIANITAALASNGVTDPAAIAAEVDTLVAGEVFPAPTNVLVEMSTLQAVGDEVIAAYVSEALTPNGGKSLEFDQTISKEQGIHREIEVPASQIGTMRAKAQQLHDGLGALIA